MHSYRYSCYVTTAHKGVVWSLTINCAARAGRRPYPAHIDRDEKLSLKVTAELSHQRIDVCSYFSLGRSVACVQTETSN